MRVEIKKLTNINLMREACEMTMNSNNKSKMSLDKIYQCEHSPIRTQLFWIQMSDIPTFVSVHFVRHKIGVEHFVKTNREDRNGDREVDRNTLVKHGMLINAQALVNMSRKRLCGGASKETQQLMKLIKKEIEKVDKDLAYYMVADCIYRNGCNEIKSCGKIITR
jgi:hypothetical protein